jgi:hypothetical protein
VCVEDAMGEKSRISECGLRNADWWVAKIVIDNIADVRAAEDRRQQFDVAWRCRFVERNADRARAERA